MPDLTQDLNYQPETKDFSYSNKNSNFTKDSKYLIYLLIAIFIIILPTLILNYFNILSLSTLYPKQLGFLPHIPYAQNKATVINTPQNLPQKTPLNIPAFTRLTNQATDDNILKYLTYMKTHTLNLKDPNPLVTIVYGAFSGYNNDKIQITTAEKIMNFSVASDSAIYTIEENQSPINTSATEGSAKVSPSYTLHELVGKIKFGDILQVSFMPFASPDKATEIIFRANFKVE